MFYKEVIQVTKVLRKDNEIAMNWLDYYWYIVATYVCLPTIFNQFEVSADLSGTFNVLFVKNHIFISQMMAMIGVLLTLIKLNRGFVKYQLRKQMYALIALGYVFMLSTVQIYNLYMGYIWVLCPLLSVRMNALFTKLICGTRTPIKPRKDPLSLALSFILTGCFAFVLSGVLSEYSFFTCRQQHLNMRPFEIKECSVDALFHSTTYAWVDSWPFIEKSETNWSLRIKPAQLHLTLIGLISCFIAPLVRYGGGILDHVFNVKEHEVLETTFGRESGLTDVFYCHGLVGAFTSIYL
jgi:phosphatidate cytidylyltransferase